MTLQALRVKRVLMLSAALAGAFTGLPGLTQTPAQPQAQTPAPMPEIRYAEGSGTPTSVPGGRSRNTSTDNVLAHVVEALVALRADMSVAPMLADSWTLSADKRSYTFTLRPGVTFHDGSPMTSADVKWSYDYLTGAKSEYSCKNLYDGTKGAKVVGVETPDAATVVFKLDQPYALFLDQMASVQCPMPVLSPKSVGADGNWVKPVGTGPYVLAEWKKDQYVLLTPYAGYTPRSEAASGMAGKKTASANVRFVVIPDAAAQKAALMAGQVDAYNADEDNLPAKDPRWNIVTEQGLDTVNLLMQTRAPLLSDANMRRAIALALDFPAIARALNNGQAAYNPSLVPAASVYYSDADRAGYEKNLKEVKRLLEAAGYRGEPLKLQANKRYPYLYRVAVVTQQLLNKAGIKTELDMLEWGTQVTNFREGKFQLMAFAYSARTEPALMFRDVIGDKAKTPMAQWESPEAAAILEGIEAESDPAVRKQAFDKLHTLMLRDTPLLMYYNKPGYVVVSSQLQGFTGWPLRKPRFFNVTKN
ncbi:ABC transporter substrate-binding protein [Achromobacter kerstersii]